MAELPIKTGRDFDVIWDVKAFGLQILAIGPDNVEAVAVSQLLRKFLNRCVKLHHSLVRREGRG